MGDYLQEIEAAYGRCREKWTMLSGLDFQLALDWERRGIPIAIVLRAIEDCCKKYKARKEPGRINALRYFEQAVDQHFAAWQKSRVGAHDPAADQPEPQQNLADAAIERCEEIILKFAEVKAPELLDAVTLVKETVMQLILQIEQTGDTQQAEELLHALGTQFDHALLTATPADEKARYLSRRRSIWTGPHMTPKMFEQLLIKDLYDQHSLPKLTLYPL